MAHAPPPESPAELASSTQPTSSVPEPNAAPPFPPAELLTYVQWLYTLLLKKPLCVPPPSAVHELFENTQESTEQPYAPPPFPAELPARKQYERKLLQAPPPFPPAKLFEIEHPVADPPYIAPPV